MALVSAKTKTYNVFVFIIKRKIIVLSIKLLMTALI